MYDEDKEDNELISYDAAAEHLFEIHGEHLPLLNNNGMVFFKPDTAFVDWLIKYSGDRIIVEIGSGTGHLLFLLYARGKHKLLGMEPSWDPMSAISRGQTKFHMLPYDVERGTKMLGEITKAKTDTTPGALVIFARPSHNGFVEPGIDALAPGTEVLYITKPENIDKFNDLGVYEDQGSIIPHEGTSADNEVVISLIKQ